MAREEKYKKSATKEALTLDCTYVMNVKAISDKG